MLIYFTSLEQFSNGVLVIAITAKVAEIISEMGCYIQLFQ